MIRKIRFICGFLIPPNPLKFQQKPKSPKKYTFPDRSPEIIFIQNLHENS